MKKRLIIIFFIIILTAVVILGIRFLSGDEDTWLCQDGLWIKHGNPSQPVPTKECLEKSVKKDLAKYGWSTMNQGPYRDKISYATGNNLINWTDSGITLAEHASVPGAVVKDGVIYVYFVDVSEDGYPEKISVLISNDNGKTWESKIKAKIIGLGDKVAVDPAPLLLGDGKIRLYYYDIEAGRGTLTGNSINKIYSAVSSDGVIFNEESGVRFERQNVFDPMVIKAGNSYKMYLGDINANKVVTATSPDGLNFTYEGIAYDNGAVPEVVFSNNEYYLYTAGINIAKSQDGVKFANTNSFFNSALGKITADPSVIKINDGGYLLFFKYKN